MSLIEKPTVGRAARQIRSALAEINPKLVFLILCAIACIYSIATGIDLQNLSVAWGFCAAVVTCFLIFVEYHFEWRFVYLKNWLCHAVNRDLALKNARMGERDWQYESWPLARVCIFAGIPTLILSVSNCIFMQDSQWYWVANKSKTTASQSFIVAFPWIINITIVSKVVAADFPVFATTTDGVKITGRFQTSMHVAPDESAVLRAGRQKNPDAFVLNEVKNAIEPQFAWQISRMKFGDVKPSVALDYNSAALAQPEIRGNGLQWTGPIAITDIHPFF